MIKAIGYNTLLLITLLVAVIVAMFLYDYKILKPELKKQTQLLNTTKREVSKMESNLDKLTAGLEKFQQQKADFQKVQDLGFFNQQNRVEAKQFITVMQKDSRLLSAKYTIKPAVSDKNEKARETGSKILKTDIEFDLEAIEDSDVYRFMYLLNYGFPGQIIINDFSMSRDVEITQPLLRRIGVGQSEPIIKASLSITWMTMVIDDSISVSDKGSELVGGIR